MHAQIIAVALFASGAFAAPAAAATPSADACASTCNTNYDTCRGKPDANMSSCASEYSTCLGYSPFDNSGSRVTPTACSATASATGTVAASVSVVTVTVTATPAALATPAAQASSNSNAAIEGAGWTVKDLIRYCSADGSGCDYNFAVSTGDDSADERCTVSRMTGSGATTESFYDVQCTDGSDKYISWGYSTQFGADKAFAVMTVVDKKQNVRAFFGVDKVNAQAVTASNPAGSGSFGDIGPQPVYNN